MRILITPPLLLLLSLLFALSPEARAENPAWPNSAATGLELMDPANWPDDPGYGFDPSNLNSDRGDWNLWSFVPPQVAGRLTPEENAMGIGLHADDAWQLTQGRFDVTIAVMDGGFLWSERDLVNKWKLNAGELPLPEGALTHDANGDGHFNVQDYTSATGHQQPDANLITDSRVQDLNGNGFLDPQDLILSFSDGKDDDQNGYIDDICGWDFMWDDNDPYDDVKNGGQGYSHGTGEARDSGAEGNNGVGGIGVCPRCSIMPLRAGDSFVAEINQFAESVYYAVDNGAQVIQEALGSINGTAFMQASLDYAYAKDVLVVASAADETSFHHNFPGSAEKTLYVHAVVYDSSPGSWLDATTFLNFNNCTNYGGHLALSTPGEGCSSEATGKSAGHAGLLYSMARSLDLQPPLSANEAYQIMTLSSDDINVAGSASDPTKYPSGPGWDHHFGYGRNNARRSVEWVRDGLVPPEAYLATPRWFETVTGETSLTIEGYVDAKRSSAPYEYELLLAPGVDPDASSFKSVSLVRGNSAAIEGKLGELKPSELQALTLPQGTGLGPHDNAATLKLVVRAKDANDPTRTLVAEYRKSFFVHRDSDLLPGYPKYLGSSLEASPRLVDVNGDGKDEIVLASSDGSIHLMQADGVEFPGFPVSVGEVIAVAKHKQGGGLMGLDAAPAQSVSSAPSVGDLNGDGSLEIVVTTLDGEVYAWDLQAQLLVGFPVGLDPQNSSWTGTRETPESTTASPIEETFILERGIFAAPTLADLNGDGKLEIVVSGMDGFLYAWDAKGDSVPGFPVEVRDNAGTKYQGTLERRRARIISTPAVGDLNGDGSLEIVVGTGEVYQGGFGNAGRGYAIWGDGNNHDGGPFMPGWPVGLCCYADVLPLVGRGVSASAALADIDGRPGLEVILHGALAPFSVFDFEGKVLLTGSSAVNDTGNAQGSLALIPLNSGSLADLTGDGFPEYIDGCISIEAAAGMSGGTRSSFDHMVCAWSLDTGDFLPGFPAVVEDYQFLHNYAAGDLDDDGQVETVSGSGGYLLHAFDQMGQEPAGWPKQTGGWIFATPALGDLDADGFIDVVVTTREGWLFAWKTVGPADHIEWEGNHHDAHATGNYQHPLRARPGPSTEGGGGGKTQGCGCSSTRHPSLPSAFLLCLLLSPLLPWVSFTRRRRVGERR